MNPKSSGISKQYTAFKASFHPAYFADWKVRQGTKAFLVGLLITLCNITAAACKTSLVNVYAGAGFGFGLKSSPKGCNLNLVFSNLWGISISSRLASLPVRVLPEEYRTGSRFYTPGDTEGEEYKYPVDQLEMTTFMIMKDFNSGNPRYLFGLEAGPSFITFNTAVFTLRPNPNRGIDHFDISYTSRKGMGFSGRAKVKLPYWRNLGCEFAVLGNLNSYRSYIGVEMYFLFGLLRDKIG